MEDDTQRERLLDLLSALPARHREALEWFGNRTGAEVSWPQPLETSEGVTFLATRAKGIYKPEWTQYALSIRQTLTSPYPDLEPVVHVDGSWSYAYFQESNDLATRDDEYANRGLMECWRDRVPVAVMKQTRNRPSSVYRILGLAVVAGWTEGYFAFEGFNVDGLGRIDRFAGTEIAAADFFTAREGHGFDFSQTIDAREKTLAQIALRRGQPQFRKQLLLAYEGRCAISGYDAPRGVRGLSHLSV